MSHETPFDPAEEVRGDPGFRESFSDAMRKTGFGKVTPGEVPTGKSLLAAVGGVRGLIEAVLPGLAFLVIYSITQNVVLSVLAPLILAVVFVIVRRATGTPITQAFAGVIGIAISAALALITGRGAENFLPGIIVNSISLLVIVVSITVRWPLIGVIVGFLTNEGLDWKKDTRKRRMLYVASWLWAGLFTVRLAVAVPLYLTNQVQWLAATKLILGIPLYAGLLWITWLMVRAVYSRAAAPIQDAAQ